MPAPISDAQLADLSMTVIEGPASITIAPARIELRADGGSPRPLAVEVHFAFEARPAARCVDAPTAGRSWLAEREGPIEVTPRVRALADQLGATEVDPWRLACRFRDHLLDQFICGAIYPDEPGPGPATDWVLDRGWFDCRLGSALLAALCRARGIPARLVGGYLLWRAPVEHYWLEVWIAGKGWMPIDLLAWDLSAGGRDPDWRAIYCGAIDYRMKTQVFPDQFTGAPGVPMGRSFHRLPRAIPGGTKTRYVAIPGGEPLYTDTIRLLTA